MEKSCLRQLKALINSFTFYPKRLFKKPLYQALWQKIRFLSEIAHPLLDKKVNWAQNFFTITYLWTNSINQQSLNEIWVLHLKGFPCQCIRLLYPKKSEKIALF